MNKTYFDSIAKEYDWWKSRNKRYYDKLKTILHGRILSSSSVIDFGCGTGDLLAYLNPDDGIGYDPSSEMIRIARSKYPSLNWSDCIPSRQFDVVYSVDVIQAVTDLDAYIIGMKRCLRFGGILLLIFANPIYEPLLLLMEKVRLKMPEGPHYRFPNRTVKNHLLKNGLKPIQLEYQYPRLKKIGLIEVWTISHIK
jgi:ubiquinone/menaquinone biosynthesis C-methylase UbiE